MAVATGGEAVQEGEALAADLEGRLTNKYLKEWKLVVGSYVRCHIFPRKQWVKDKEIERGSELQKIICKKTLKRFPLNGSNLGWSMVEWR